MGYVDTVLRPDENIVYNGKIHPIIYVRGICFMAVGIFIFGFAGNLISENDPHDDQDILRVMFLVGLFVFLIGLKSFLSAAIYRWTTEIAVTTRRVFIKKGLVWRQTMEMNLNKIESVWVRQSVIGRLLNYGTVDVRGTGSSIEDLNSIASPVDLRYSIESSGPATA